MGRAADALAATAVAAVREIQVLQAPHIAEADDAAMTRLEQQMAAAEAEARRALAALPPPGAGAAAGPQVASAARRARPVHGRERRRDCQALSRRNSDSVRSLALSLGQKRLLTAQCEEVLLALQRGVSEARFWG